MQIILVSGALSPPVGLVAASLIYMTFLFTHCGGFKLLSLKAFFLCGMLLTIIMNDILVSSGIPSYALSVGGAISQLFVLSLFEEFAKLLSIFAIARYSPRPALEIHAARSTDFKTFVYCGVATGFGFAIIENVIFYYLHCKDIAALPRVVCFRTTMLCLHPMFTGLAALIFAKSRDWIKSKTSRFCTAFLISTIPHFSWNVFAHYFQRMTELNQTIYLNSLVIVPWVGLLVLIWKVKGMVDV